MWCEHAFSQETRQQTKHWGGGWKQGGALGQNLKKGWGR